MSPKSDRRAATLSISLTQELAAAVSSRVDSGLYTSASELIREALRLLLRSESLQRRPRVDAPDEEPLSAHRFTEAAELMDLGLEMQAEKIRQANQELSPAEVRARLDELADEQEAGPGLRIAPERLSKQRLRESS
jgi:putative addiction module CopG family antidote